MQWKLAQPSRLTDWLHRWALRRGFPLLLRIAPRLPRWFLLFNARWIIWLTMAVYPAPRRFIRTNLARVLGTTPDDRRVRRVVRAMLRHFAFYWTDLFRFAQLPLERGVEVLDGVYGEHHLEAARAAGRGAILLTAHLGNWELGSVLLGGRDIPVSVVYVPDKFEDAERFRSELRRACAVDEIPIQPDQMLASLPVLRALRENRLVAMQGDRDINDKGPRLPFFGKPATFPLGPFILAHLTGAPIIPAFITYTPRYRFEAHFGNPINLVPEREREEEVRHGMAQWVKVLEDTVRRYPEQWYTFYDFWQDGRKEKVEGAAREARPASA